MNYEQAARLWLLRDAFRKRIRGLSTAGGREPSPLEGEGGVRPWPDPGRGGALRFAVAGDRRPPPLPPSGNLEGTFPLKGGRFLVRAICRTCIIVSRRGFSPRVVLKNEGAGRFRSASQDLFVALAKAPRAAVTKPSSSTLPSRAAWSPGGRRTQGHAAKQHLAKGSRPWMDPLGLRRVFGLRDLPHGAARPSGFAKGFAGRVRRSLSAQTKRARLRLTA